MPGEQRFEDIPTIAEARRRGRRPTVQARAAAAAYRIAERRWGGGGAQPGVVSGTLAITAGLLQLVPTRLLWGGALQQYSTYGDCASYQYDGPCASPCFGFAPHHMDAFYCATCAEEQNVPGNYGYWHFVGNRWFIQYMDREPDVCLGRDAWKWGIPGPCGSCASSVTFRCHDGWKRYPNAATWDPTICEGLVLCDRRLVVC